MDVLLESAFQWSCPNCLSTNYGSFMPIELTPAEKEEALRSEFEIEDWDTLPDELRELQAYKHPSNVTCCHCHTSYGVIEDEEE